LKKPQTCQALNPTVAQRRQLQLLVRLQLLEPDHASPNFEQRSLECIGAKLGILRTQPPTVSVVLPFERPKAKRAVVAPEYLHAMTAIRMGLVVYDRIHRGAGASA
jgi:hypothetical protein